MPYLSPAQRADLANAIITTVGYLTNIRNIFLAEVNLQFRLMMDVDPNPMVQLDLDLIRLNNTERLTDGSIPFHSWLEQGARYTRPYPAASRIVEECLAIVEGKAIKSAPVANLQSPTPATIGKIVEEKSVNGNDMLSYAWLEAGMQAGIGVARLRVTRYDNGQPRALPGGGPTIYTGTGWLLTKSLIITNHHVIGARSENEPDASPGDLKLQGENTTVQFDYNADDMTGHTIGVTSLEVANAEFDYAILRLKQPVDRLPPARFLDAVSVTDDTPQAVNIIQHPYGYSKKVAIRNNHIFRSVYPKILYFTDTEKGSSGSPVFDDRWRVVALHRATQLVTNVVYQGKTTGWVNEGVQLTAIFQHLKENFPALNTEILSPAPGGN